jgi:hypothetical protein
LWALLVLVSTSSLANLKTLGKIISAPTEPTEFTKANADLWGLLASQVFAQFPVAYPS